MYVALNAAVVGYSELLVCVYRPLRADECLPVLTHRHVPESTSDKDVTGDKQASTSRRHRKDSHRKSDSKVVLCSTRSVVASVNFTDVTADSRKL